MEIEIGLSITLLGDLPHEVTSKADLENFVRGIVESLCETLNARPVIAKAELSEQEAIQIGAGNASAERVPTGATIQ